MSLSAIPKVKRIVSFQLIGQLGSCVQIIHVAVHKQNNFPKPLCTFPTTSYDWDTSTNNFVLLYPAHAYLCLHFIAIQHT